MTTTTTITTTTAINLHPGLQMVAFFQVFLPKFCILHNKMMPTTYRVQDNYDTFPYTVLPNLLLLLSLKYKHSPQYPALRSPKSMLRVKKPPHNYTKL